MFNISYKGVQADFAFRGELHRKDSGVMLGFKQKRETRRSRRLCPENLGRKSVCTLDVPLKKQKEASST
jgi:hypothetical protein